MIDFEHIDETLDIDAVANYEMSIQLRPDGLSFSVLDSLQKKYILLKYLSLPGKKDPARALKKLYEKSELLSAGFKKVHLLYACGPQTLLPDNLYKADKLEDIYRFNLGLEEEHTVLSSPIPEFGLHTLFALPTETRERLQKLYPKAAIHHLSETLLKTLSLYSAGEFPVMLIHREQDLIWIAAKEKSKLLFFNSFHYRSDTDLVYFSALASRQCGLQGKKHNLLLSGLFEEEDEAIPLLKEYHPLINKAKPHPDYSLSYLFQEVPEAAFVNLLTLAACAS